MRTLTVAGQPFKVVTESVARLGADELGESDPEDNQITISAKVKPEDFKRVLWHEGLHGILARTGWSELLKQIGEHAEEGLVLALEYHAWHLAQQIQEYNWGESRAGNKTYSKRRRRKAGSPKTNTTK